MTTIKVRINFTVEVDADGWEMDYGVTGADLRDDVKAYIRSLINEANGNMTVSKVG